MSKAAQPEFQSSTTGLGRFAEGARSWDRMISNATAAIRAEVFRNCCHEGAGYLAFGVDRAALADALTELACRHNLERPLGGSDGIQQTISDAFVTADKKLADDKVEIKREGERQQGPKWASRLPSPPPSRFAERFQLMRLADIELNDDPMYLVDDIIPAGPALGVIFGQPKTGKTFLAIDLFLHIAMGKNYCGCSVRQGAVVYITSEGIRGFKRRMVAMRQHAKADPEVPFFVAYVMPNLGALPGDIEELVEAIRKHTPEGMPVAAVIIDTLARAIAGQSDSDAAAMGIFVDNCDAIAKAFDCFVGVVHHSPRGDPTHSRGSNVLDGAADVIISVVKDDPTGVSTAKVDRLKDGTEGATWQFRVAAIELLDRNGSTCFVPMCETLGTVTKNVSSETSRNRKLSGQQRRFVDILANAMIDHGVLVVGSTVVPTGVTAVEREQLRNCCFDAGFLDREKRDGARSTFSRMINTLAGEHVIGATKDHVWLPKLDRAKQAKQGETSSLVSTNTDTETPKHPPME